VGLMGPVLRRDVSLCCYVSGKRRLTGKCVHRRLFSSISPVLNILSGCVPNIPTWDMRLVVL
jgi:hypothetical protein